MFYGFRNQSPISPWLPWWQTPPASLVKPWPLWSVVVRHTLLQYIWSIHNLHTNICIYSILKKINKYIIIATVIVGCVFFRESLYFRRCVPGISRFQYAVCRQGRIFHVTDLWAIVHTRIKRPLFGPTNLKTWPINILPYDNEKWHVHVCINIIYKYLFFKISGNIFTLHFLYDAILKILMYVYIYINANKHTHTLDKKWIIEVILGKWIPSHAIRLDLYIYGLWWSPAAT